MLRITQKLRGAEQEKSPRPDGVGIRNGHQLLLRDSSREPVEVGRGRQSGPQTTMKARTEASQPGCPASGGCRVSEEIVRVAFSDRAAQAQTADAIFCCSGSPGNGSGAGSMLCERSGRAARKL